MARPARSEEEVERVRQSILDAAERVLANNSLDGASLEAIGAEAGFKPASIYTYFESRDVLLGHVIERTWQRVGGAIEAEASEELDETLRRIAHDMLQIMATHRGVLELLLGRRIGFGEPGMLERLRAYHREAAGRLAGILAESLPGADAMHLAYAFFGLLRAEALFLLAERGPADLDRGARAVVDLFLHGARAVSTAQEV